MNNRSNGDCWIGIGEREGKLAYSELSTVPSGSARRQDQWPVGLANWGRRQAGRGAPAAGRGKRVQGCRRAGPSRERRPAGGGRVGGCVAPRAAVCAGGRWVEAGRGCGARLWVPTDAGRQGGRQRAAMAGGVERWQFWAAG